MQHLLARARWDADGVGDDLRGFRRDAGRLGPERTSRVSPLDEWLAVGASLAAGTDIARPFNPMTAV